MKNTVTLIDFRRRYNGAIYTQVVTNLSLPPKLTEIYYTYTKLYTDQEYPYVQKMYNSIATFVQQI